MFENVTYEYYTQILNRSIIPTEEEFNSLILLNEKWIERYLDYIDERATNGIDNSVCLLCEVDYKENTKNKAENATVASESVSGHSVSYLTSQKAKEEELNAKSIDQKKWEIVKLFCDVSIGV